MFSYWLNDVSYMDYIIVCVSASKGSSSFIGLTKPSVHESIEAEILKATDIPIFHHPLYCLLDKKRNLQNQLLQNLSIF